LSTRLFFRLSPRTLKEQGKTLIDHYGEILIERKETLKSLSGYLAVDGYFAKKGFIEAVTEQAGLEVISKLRNDADLKYLYKGPHVKRKGAPMKFDGKIDIQNPDQRRIPLVHEDEDCKIYSAIVWSIRLKRKIKIAYVRWWNRGKDTGKYAVLFSTDLLPEGLLIYQYYRSRFQIEFLFRDAKQYCGLNHCQAGSADKLHFHFNTSLSTVSLAKAIHFLTIKKQDRGAFSIEDVKTLYANKIMAERIF